MTPQKKVHWANNSGKKLTHVREIERVGRGKKIGEHKTPFVKVNVDTIHFKKIPATVRAMKNVESMENNLVKMKKLQKEAESIHTEVDRKLKKYASLSKISMMIGKLDRTKLNKMRDQQNKMEKYRTFLQDKINEQNVLLNVAKNRLRAQKRTITGSIALGNKISAQVSRNGDLMTDVVVEVVLTKSAAGLNTYYPAEALLSEVELEIGGQRIDKHYADWFRVYDNLFRKDEDQVNYRNMTDFVNAEASGSQKRFYVPLVFFFNSAPGLALPLIALQYHEVKLYFTLAASVAGVSAIASFNVYVDYVFLDTQERSHFAEFPHEYLIEQLQFTGSETATPSATTQSSQNIRLNTMGRKSITPFASGHCDWENRLDFQAPTTGGCYRNFNHPTKYIAWVFRGNTHGAYVGTPAYANADVANLTVYDERFALLDSAKLQLNGQDRFSTRKGSYFNKVQPYQTIGSQVPAGTYLYSFALKPAGRQPSGTCNFSRIDNATLSLTYKTASQGVFDVANVGNVETTTSNVAIGLTALNIYAKNFNVDSLALKSYTPFLSGIQKGELRLCAQAA